MAEEMQAAHDAWLAQTPPEDVLEPSLPIIDPHHHLWYRLASRPFAMTYMMEELSRDIRDSGHNIVATVYMQSSRANWRRADGPEELKVVGESELMQGIAVLGESGLYGPTRVCAGIVGTADLLLGAGVEAVLRAHGAAARNFRGIRYLGGKAEQIPFADPRLVEAARVLARVGLVLDVNGPETPPLDFEGVLGGLAGLAAAVPELTIVLDHCGGAIGPDAAEGGPQWEAWAGGLRRLAAHPNVFAKVGGLHMEVNGLPLGRDRREAPIGSEELAGLTLPFIRVVVEAFGPERCMFESNFPVDRWGVSYRVLWNGFKRVAQELALSEESKAAMFSGTAARVYRLSLPQASAERCS